MHVDPRNVHAYVIGEHGDSEFIPWSNAMVSTKSVLSILEESNGAFNQEHLASLEEDVRTAA